MKIIEHRFGQIKALVREPQGVPAGVLVLLHGVGSNERNMLDLSPSLTDDRLVVSLRGPIELGPGAFAWFHVQFTEGGPVHNWPEAKRSLSILEESLATISKTYDVPLERFAIFGFSQGAIMTIGLALGSELKLERYVASSGRTLPEFAKLANTSPRESYKSRRIFVLHGVQDSKLPVALGRATETVLRNAGLDYTYSEFDADHGMTREMSEAVRKWLKHR